MNDELVCVTTTVSARSLPMCWWREEDPSFGRVSPGWLGVPVPLCLIGIVGSRCRPVMQTIFFCFCAGEVVERSGGGLVAGSGRGRRWFRVGVPAACLAPCATGQGERSKWRPAVSRPVACPQRRHRSGSSCRRACACAGPARWCPHLPKSRMRFRPAEQSSGPACRIQRHSRPSQACKEPKICMNPVWAGRSGWRSAARPSENRKTVQMGLHCGP
jgi:hypothetical protein